MSYCNKIKYNILRAENAEFALLVDQLLAELPCDESIVRLTFFGRPADNVEYLNRYSILKEKTGAFFGSNMPALSYVSQPALGATLLLEVHSYQKEESESLSYKSLNGFPYVILESKHGKTLFAGGFQGDIINDNMDKQSVDVLGYVEQLLNKEGFPINSIVRQWNYIEQITKFNGEDQHYQSFNNARADFYDKTIWVKGYPAATGIGTNLGGVLIDFDAVMLTSDSDSITPIDNKLQIAAHAYSERVLESALSQKKTPKFERAKSLTIDGNCLIYVSGTAAIRGEESLKGVGVSEQLRITMENIAVLIDNAKLSLLRVYLKNKEDFEVTREQLSIMQPDITVSYMCADVCRDELLIEIEGIAVK